LVQKKTNVYFEEKIDNIQNGYHVGENRKTESGNVDCLNKQTLL